MSKLLVVDDEIMMRECVTAILTAIGYNVVEAKDGVEALKVYEAMRSEIALIIMDIIMPRMDGITATNAIKAIEPSAKVILMSGTSEQLPVEEKADAFLSKPFRGKDLVEMVQKVIQDLKPIPWVVLPPQQN